MLAPSHGVGLADDGGRDKGGPQPWGVPRAMLFRASAVTMTGRTPGSTSEPRGVIYGDS